MRTNRITTRKIITRLGREVEVAEDYSIPQKWEQYTDAEHDRWNRLYERQTRLLRERACPEFFQSIDDLDLGGHGIPKFDELSERLTAMTGWKIVAVPDLVPDDIFFGHLANRQFPAGNFIRPEDKLDYIQEPDVFHDIFGHAPLLSNPVFAEYMQAYGKAGIRAHEIGALKFLSRLYWYTVEFGLMHSAEGLRIYGSGIVSSKNESIFCLEDASPNRVHFDLERVMRTNYRINDFQETYFVIDGFEELRDAIQGDLESVYDRCRDTEPYAVDAILDSDRVYTRGTQEYAYANQTDLPEDML